MILGLYAVFDVCSGVYDGPFPQRADAEAQRNFTGMVNKVDSPIGQNPEDFTLFKVGVWNDATGEIEKMPAKKLLNGAEAVSNVIKLKEAQDA